MTWKVINISNPGTSIKFGADDTDKINKGFSGIDVDDYDINSDYFFRNGKLHIRNPANTFSYNVIPSAITADRNVTEPLLTSNDTRVYQAFSQTLTNKTIDLKDNTIKLKSPTYFIFKESTTYYAIKYDGTKTSNTSLHTLIQNIYNGITPAGTPTTIEFAEGDFTAESFMEFTSDKIGNLTIKGQGMGKTNIILGTGFDTEIYSPFIFGGGPSNDTPHLGTLTANANIGDQQVTMSSGDAAKFAVGDYVKLVSTKDWIGGSTGVAKQSEIHRVWSKPDSTHIFFDEPIWDTYNTADTSKLLMLDNILKNITIKDLTIKSGDTLDSGSTCTVFVYCNYVDNMTVEGVEILNPIAQFDSGVTMQSCLNSQYINCRVKLDPESSIGYNLQYGLIFRGSCQNCRMINCHTFGNLRHPFEVATGGSGSGQEGLCRNIVVDSCSGWDAEVSVFDTHADGENINIVNCTASGTSLGYGFYARCSNVHFIDCQVIGSFDMGLWLEENAHNCRIDNFSVLNPGSGTGIYVNDDLTGIDISGTFVNCVFQAIWFNGGNNHIKVHDCTFDTCGGSLSSSEGIIQTNGYCENIMVVNNDFGKGNAPADARPFVADDAIDKLLFSDNNTIELTNKTPLIPTNSGFIRVNSSNLGTNPINKITNFLNTTNNTISFYEGTTSTVVASTNYLIEGCDIIITSTGGTGVSITLKDNANNTVASGLATLSAVSLPMGYKVNFGAFSGAPTVTVFGI